MIKKIFLFLIPVLAVYFLLAYYYKDGFCLNTWINGVYCTGKTVEEINAELLSETEAPIIVIQTRTANSIRLIWRNLVLREIILRR